MVLLTTSLDNQNLLRGLEILVVALIWLFFLRVMRAVWVEVRPPKRRRVAPEPEQAPPPPPAQSARRERGAKLHLKVVEPEQLRGHSYDLPEEVTVGRAAGCGVRVEDSYTSSLHARVYRRDSTLWVEDLGSTNGTWVNAERIGEPTKLGRGDLVQVGGTVFEVTR
jgi:pSer/pThr/pTyr-binding forkhead associated (FHA) protein